MKSKQEHTCNQGVCYAAMVSEDSKHILAIIESKRELLGMSKAELARRMGMGPVTMGTLLRGERSIFADEVFRLCACLDIDPTELMSPDVRKLHSSYWSKGKRA